MFKQHYHIFTILLILALQFQFLLPVYVESVSRVYVADFGGGPFTETPLQSFKRAPPQKKQTMFD